MTAFRTETLTRLRGTRDRFGDPTPGSEQDIDGCVVWPRDANASGSNEHLDGRDTVIVGYSALLPPGTDVKATDQIRWRGSVYDVIGEPGVYTTPFSGTDPGVTISLQRVTG